MGIEWAWPLKRSFISKITDERVCFWWSSCFPIFSWASKTKKKQKWKALLVVHVVSLPIHLSPQHPCLFPERNKHLDPPTILGPWDSSPATSRSTTCWHGEKPQTNSTERLEGKSPIADPAVSSHRRLDNVCSMNLTVFIWPASRHDDSGPSCPVWLSWDSSKTGTQLISDNCKSLMTLLIIIHELANSYFSDI